MIYTNRKAQETDKEAIYHLYRLVMHGLVYEIWGWDEKWQENDFSDHFDPQGITLVHIKQKLVGYCQVENRGKQLFIRMIVVHPRYRRTGIGGKLLKSVIALGDEQSRGVCLEVFKINREAIKFYENYSFSVTGETPYSYIMAIA